MAKQVRETAAGQAISAFVILNPKGRHVATVQVHHGSTVTVDVWNIGDDAVVRTAKAMGHNIDPDSGRILRKDGTPGEYPCEVAGFQQGRAGGYGYDKLTAALSGLIIDGHAMSDHCARGKAPKPPKGLQRWPSDAKPPRGYVFANYQSRFITFGFNPEKHEREGFTGNDGYDSCYRLEGFKYLEAFGYGVIRAI